MTAADDILPKARQLHFSSIVVDTHDDTTQRLLDPGFDIGVRHTDGDVDIPRMREGGLGAIFFSIWMSGSVTGPEAVKRSLDQIDAVREMVRTHSKDLVLCTTAEEVRAAHAAGKIAVLIGVEGGHMIDSDLAVLRSYAALGVRYMTLTHSVNDEWADSSTDKPAHNGLTDFGKDVVREMNRLGVIVDISHVADKTFYDALEVSRAPLIASHSSCRALCNAPRNMTDDMIRAVATYGGGPNSKGGVVQVNFFSGFVSQAYWDALNAQKPEVEKAVADAKEKAKAEGREFKYADEEKIQRSYMDRIPRPPLSMLIDHIDHIAKVAGVDHVGLGSDFDGVSGQLPEGLDSPADLPKITAALMARGYSTEDCRKILGGNLLRVFREVQAVSKELQAEERPRISDKQPFDKPAQ